MPPGEQLRPLAPLSFNERAHSYISQPIIRIALIGVTLALIGGYFLVVVPEALHLSAHHLR